MNDLLTEEEILLSKNDIPLFLQKIFTKDNILDTFKYCIENKIIDIEFKDKYGNNLLHLLCKYNQTKDLLNIIKYIVDKNIIDTVTKNKCGDNFLHILCRYNKSKHMLKILKYIFNDKSSITLVDVNVKNKHDENILHMLCKYNDSKYLLVILKYIIENNIVNINEISRHGGNFLHLLCKNNHTKYLYDIFVYIFNNQFIDKTVINMHTKSYFGESSLDYLCAYYLQPNGRGNIFEYLLANNVDIGIKNNFLSILYKKNKVNFNLLINFIIKNNLQSIYFYNNSYKCLITDDFLNEIKKSNVILYYYLLGVYNKILSNTKSINKKD